jgi:tetratricopeptide (TPR) repeat protein
MAENGIEETRREALQLLEEGRGADALDRVWQPLRARSDDPRFWELRGVILSRLKLHCDAIESYNQALRLHPDEHLLPYVWNNKGISLFQLERYEEARDAFSQASKKSWPFEAEAHNNLGLALLNLNLPCDAVEEFKKATQRKSGFPEAFNNLGQAFAKLGEEPETLASYNQALKLRDCFPEAHANRGRIFEKRKKLEKALSDYEAAAAQSPNCPRYELDCVRMLHALGRPEAKRRLRALLAREPVFAEAAYLLTTEPLTWWDWWFGSRRKHPWHFGLGVLLLILFVACLVLPLLHFCTPLPISVGAPWHQYVLTAVGSLLLLLSPVIRRLRIGEVEVVLRTDEGEATFEKDTQGLTSRP